MSYAASTVNVVTTDGPAGRGGVTVSAMTSVSADGPKPTLLVCVHKETNSVQRLLKNEVFCVNMLKDNQSHISDVFAGRTGASGEEKFECANWTRGTTGAPRVVDPLVAFDCKLFTTTLVGTHFVLIGEVASVFASERGSPLLYSQRGYGRAERIV
jgi:flavin reductase (DIM6/NTAB) family NADH-FMN oxidoreductase RutF